MLFHEAMKLLKEGSRVTRKEWSPGNFLLIRETEQHGPLAELYVDNGKSRLTWTPNQRDMHAEDWEIGPEATPIRVFTTGLDVFGPMGGR